MTHQQKSQKVRIRDIAIEEGLKRTNAEETAYSFSKEYLLYQQAAKWQG